MNIKSMELIARTGVPIGALILSACAPVGSAPTLPQALQAPPGQALAFETRATGVQIYECAAQPSAAGRAAWTFKAPEADLFDLTGRKIGRHYGGPTWEASDGSKVVAAVTAREDAPVADAIPWLLLAARANAGMGRFERTSTVQRVDTAGGVVPVEPCTTRQLGAQRRVPYSATYLFYQPADRS